jgi:multiple sugar transport system ATP-binding protein
MNRDSHGAAIVFSGVRKAYGRNVALEALDLRIEEGEFVSLLGPSGSGKSTTLNILAGLLEPDAGRVEIGGLDVTGLTPDKRDIAMVFQSYALYPHMTVEENLAFPLQAPGRRLPQAEIDRKVTQVAETLRIGQLLQRYPKEISGGQQQRVALGRAMIRDPGVFLLDEPLSNLDARLRLQMRKDLKALHQRLRSTIVYVTHDQSEAMGLSDRIAIYRGGRLQQLAPPMQVYREPANLFVAQFMGEREMNTLHGTIRTGQGDDGFATAAGFLALGANVDAFARFAGTRTVLGFRPESVVVGRAGAQPWLEARVTLVEQGGADQVFFADFAGQELCVRTPVDVRVGIGDTVPLTVPPSDLYLFERDSGLALVHGGRPAAGAGA